MTTCLKGEDRQMSSRACPSSEVLKVNSKILSASKSYSNMSVYSVLNNADTASRTTRLVAGGKKLYIKEGMVAYIGQNRAERNPVC